jgi:MoaA/NifB/PqqE/SkfB family radical SAM enzyme
VYLRDLYLDLLALQGILWSRQPWCGPRIAQIDISDDCNLDCAICNRSCMGVGGLMPEHRVRALIDELYALGTQEIFFHGFGEPACHPQLPGMILHVRSHYPKLRQHLITNGTWNSPALDAALIRGRVAVRFSLHAGDEWTWQQMHPRDDPRFFRQAGDNLHRLAAAAPDRVEVLYVLCNLNFRKIPEMLVFALKCGVRKVLFRPMRLFKGRDGRYMNDSLQLNAQQYREAADILARCRQEFGRRIRIQSVPFERNRYDPELGRASSRDFYISRGCYIGYVLTVIEKDGSVYGCLPESSGGQPLGNVFDTPFRDIWFGPEYAAFRKKQLFSDKAQVDPDGCPSYCQHLETNVRLNRFHWRNRLPKFLR